MFCWSWLDGHWRGPNYLQNELCSLEEKYAGVLLTDVDFLSVAFQTSSTYFVGFNQNMRIVIAQTTITDITAVAIPANSGAPRYRAVNVDAITVDTSLSGQCGSGVLVSDDGTVQALWLTYLGERSPVTHKDTDYHLGLATPTLLPVIKQIQNGIQPKLRMLSVEFNLSPVHHQSNY